MKKTSKRTVVSRKYGFSNFVLDPTIVYWSQSITFCDRVSESERCFSGNGESGKSNSRDHTLLPNLVSRFRYSDRKNVHLLERAFLQFRKLATKKRKKPVSVLSLESFRSFLPPFVFCAQSGGCTVRSWSRRNESPE